MNKKILTLIFSVVMALLLTMSLDASVEAKVNPVGLNNTKINLTINKSSTGKTKYGKTAIKIKAAKGYKVKSKSFMPAKKSIISVSKKGVVTAKKKGTTKVTVTVKYKKVNKKKIYTKKMTVKVTVRMKLAKPAKPSEPTTPVFTPSASDKKLYISGTHSIDGPTPKKTDMTYVKSINLGGGEYASSDNLDGGVIGQIYLMNVPGNDKFYAMFIKTVTPGATMSTGRQTLNRYLYKQFNETDVNKMSLACVVFENKVVAATCKSMFEGFMGESSFRTNKYIANCPYGIYNMENFDTSHVKNFESMFKSAFSSVERIDFCFPEDFNVSSAQSMERMFNFAGNVRSEENTLAFPQSFDTSNVKNFYQMFMGTYFSKLILPKKFVFTPSSTLKIDKFLYASRFKYIENETPLNTKGSKDCICLPSNGTYETMKVFVDELDFSTMTDAGLMLYENKDTKLINYVLEKISKEAVNICAMHMVCTAIEGGDIVADFGNFDSYMSFSGFVQDANIKSLTLKNAKIKNASELFYGASIDTIDISSCTFSEDCDTTRMFDGFDLDGVPTIYVKDKAMQTMIIDAFNSTCDKYVITVDNVIIKK